VGESLEKISLVSPDVADHVFKLVVTVQKVEKMSVRISDAWCPDER